MQRAIVTSLLTALIFVFSCPLADETPDKIHHSLSTDAAMEFGQVVKGEYSGGTLDHLWTSRLGVWLRDEATVDSRLQINISAGLIAWSPVPTGVFWQSREPYWSPSLGEAQAIYKFGDMEKPWLEAAIGYFPFKYNPQARNLGEYMYRTQAYPPIIMNTSWIIVNRDFANLMGLHLTSKIGPFKQDLLVTTETEWDPLWDASIGYLAGVNIADILDLGAGINFWRYLSVNEKRTAPKTLSNMYMEGGDTLYYSYKSIKTVGRATFDPKRFFPSAVFGEEDLKIYSEAAILGLIDYGTWYDTLIQRMPIMLGFNFPTFKILDVLSMEWEWFGSPYPNDMKDMIQNMIPTPVSLQGSPLADDIKWSVFLQKQVVRGLDLRLQVARDHLRLVDHVEKRLFYRENIRTQDQWYWMVQIAYGI